MHREIEKMYKQFKKFMEEHSTEEMSESEIRKLIDEFERQYNESTMKGEEDNSFDESDSEKIYDYLEMAFETEDDSKRLKYAKEVLKMDKDNLDAEYLIASTDAKDSIDMLNRLEKILKHGNEIVEREGFMNEENIGEFWEIVETRPYMRIKQSYAEILAENGMMKKAVKEYEEILKLNENDNLGVRFRLMSLYAFFEDEENALKLYKKYNGQNSVQMLLPISVLYFKKGEFTKSLNYLKKIEKNVKGFKKFFKDMMNERGEFYLNQLSSMGYRPFSTDELILSMTENDYLFLTASSFVEWAYEKLGKKTGGKSKKVVKLKK